jgi:hypothetical protein
MEKEVDATEKTFEKKIGLKGDISITLLSKREAEGNRDRWVGRSKSQVVI